MKWILIIVLITVIMIIARAVSEQYRDKYNFYKNLKDFLASYKINVSFRQEKINEFISNVSSSRQFTLFLNEYKEFTRTGKINLDSIKLLDDDEKVELRKIVTSIGRLDAKNEAGQVDNFMLSVDAKLKSAESDKNKLCPMILKLSLLFAIALAILLI